MSTNIDFYFDFSSPYGYLAAMKIDALAAKYQRQVEWHPILLGVIFKSTGSQPLVNAPLKGPYSLHDIKRTARFHQIPFHFPTPFPISTQHTARVMLAIANKCGKEKAIEFAKMAFHAFFVDGKHIGEVEQITPLLVQMGLDAVDIVNESGSQEVKDQLRDEVDSALKLGVFGSPFIIVDKEPFWGFDRFDQIEAMLKNGKI